MDLLNYKDRDDVVDVVSKFIKENSLLNNLIGERLIKLISLVKEFGKENFNECKDYLRRLQKMV